jgi:hypothetical protein
MSTKTIDLARGGRRSAISLVAVWGLLLGPQVTVYAAADDPNQSTVVIHAKSFAETVKRDAKSVGKDCKAGALRVSAAAKSLGHKIATAAKRSATDTRAAFRDDKA